MRSKSKLFLIFLFLTTQSFCQIDTLKWQKANLSYENPDEFGQRTYSFESDNAGEFIKKSLVNAYWFFISDVDGDNCAFRPSCSSFFIEATDKTNIFQGTLMFSDRLVRDLNPVKLNSYPIDKSGHYYDPAINYILNKESMGYIPPEIIVDDE